MPTRMNLPKFLMLIALFALPGLACNLATGSAASPTAQALGDAQSVSTASLVTTPSAVAVAQGTAPPPPAVGEPTSLTATPTRLSDDVMAPLDAEEQMVINVYERVSPAVVHITSRVTTMDFFFGAMPSEGTGSGFVVDKEGHVVTNYHVIEGADTIVVTLSDETTIGAQVVGVDPQNDLALLRIEAAPEELNPVELGSSADLRVGQRAIAIGNPFGLDRTLTVGVISALGRPLQTNDQNLIYDVVQTDAAINPGNSGGPLLDSRGRVIAVNTAIRQGAEGIGFAVPVDTLHRVLPSLKQLGYYPHPWLGFLGYDITPALAGALELPVEKGILVARLYSDGPAAAAGMQGAQREVVVGNQRILAGGDIVVGIDQLSVSAWEDLSAYLELNTEVGDQVLVRVLRDGDPLELQLDVAEEP